MEMSFSVLNFEQAEIQTDCLQIRAFFIPLYQDTYHKFCLEWRISMLL